MKKTLLLVSAIIIVISWYSCQYKKEAIDYPASTCDTSNIRYSVEIVGIMQANCYVCHATAVANSLGGGNKYDSYNNIRPNVASGLLLNCIMQNPGYDAMPKGGPRISNCDIAKFRTWIRNGYPNN